MDGTKIEFRGNGHNGYQEMVIQIGASIFPVVGTMWSHSVIKMMVDGLVALDKYELPKKFLTPKMQAVIDTAVLDYRSGQIHTQRLYGAIYDMLREKK